MPRSTQHIPHFDFLRNKYGPELLLDVGRMESLKNFVLDNTPHTLSFYDVLFLQEGSGTFSLDQVVHTLEPGKIIFTSPGQVRRWRVEQPVRGYTLFFEEGFISSFFNDPLFLHRFQFFHNPTRPNAVMTSGEEFRRFIQQVEAMEQEFKHLQNDSPHMIRALLYQMLMHLNRLFAQQHQTDADTEGNASIYSFRKLLETHFRERHQVQEYADLLHITPAHLNEITQRYFGTSASSLIKGRLLLEAKRELLYTPKTVSEIAYHLHFSDTANFNRFFRSSCGLTPKDYREQALVK
ncbi:helix-turn-helix domain-containing protein [Rufibacter hautae]|uniref:Helix-turn-helix domain-containing protein n=1 Tax=Rufibacter hautae TaxID=2595005 RepID=A0A5B6TKV0_9BACT|nr:AraC family transcriptional regulator [Rufibacter hautae]KAA3440100.1 helix-turn-helix domain-containing protein [Rufibacter hautae]